MLIINYFGEWWYVGQIPLRKLKVNSRYLYTHNTSLFKWLFKGLYMGWGWPISYVTSGSPYDFLTR